MKKFIKKKRTKTKNKCIRRRKKELEIRINNVNNEHLRLVNYFKKLKKNPKKNASKHKELEKSKESDFEESEESDYEESEEYKNFYEELNEIIKNGESSESINKKNIHHMNLKRL